MRPIKLDIKGLHSFREKQTIDFETLCGGGVFGIFGPTGSGKSSILDAMTLALYGKVERALNNTQGILNHGEDELYVSFTFQLGQGQRSQQYTVERSFKRSGDIQIRSATSRFLEGFEDPVVLADKATDVNREVENLLGLSIDDFTRAVVLPQGKFSEFLSLKGTERRQMLQRLFHLEKYGDELNAKLKERLANKKHEKDIIEVEQNTLGHATKEAVKEKEAELKEVIYSLEECKKEEIVLEKRADEEKEVFSLQVEKVKAEQYINSLLQKEAEIDEKKIAFNKAEEAKSMRPFLLELEKSKEEIEKANLAVESARVEFELGKKLEKESQVVFQNIKEMKEKSETPYRLKLDKLEQLMEEEKLLIKEREDIAVEEKTLESLQAVIEDSNKALKKAEVDLKRYEDKRSELEKELAESLVKTDEKRKVYKAVEDKQAIDLALTQREEQAKESRLLKERHAGEMEKLKNLEVELEEKKEKLSERYEQLYTWYEQICEQEEEIRAYHFNLKERIEELEERNELIIINRLRKELRENEACPVCGSREHPHHDQDELVEETLEIEEVKKVQQLLEVLEPAQRRLEKLKWTLQESSNKLSEFIQINDDESINKLPRLDEKKDHRDFNLENFEEKWQEKQNILSKQTEAMTGLIERIHDDIKGFRERKELLKEQEINEKSLAEQLKDQIGRQEKSDQAYEEKLLIWTREFPYFSIETVNDIYEDIQKREEASEKLRERIENSRPHIEGKKKTIDEVKKVIQENQMKEASLNGILSQRSKRITEMSERLAKAVGNSTAVELHEQTKKELDQLLQAYEGAEKDWNEKKEKVNELERTLALNKKALHHGQEWGKRAKESFEAELLLTSFQTVEEVTQATLSEEVMAELKKEVDTFTEDKQSALLKLEETKKKLGNRQITEEEKIHTINLLQDLKEKIEILGSEKGKVEGALEELKKKVARYEELEKERLKIEYDYSQLQKLEQVFRGKAFVEYIAEEQLIQVSRLASDRLHALTRGRYALEVDSNGGFVIRDDANGAMKRPVSTLSGGETFLTSLALALSLSTSIQLKGEHPLEFFFLDEGFGTLDGELLETVISALEKLHTDKLSVGVISHVPELKERLPRKITVIPAEAGGRGSRVKLEIM